MIETHDSSPIAYKSLADIRLHKEMVRNDRLVQADILRDGIILGWKLYRKFKK